MPVRKIYEYLLRNAKGMARLMVQHGQARFVRKKKCDILKKFIRVTAGKVPLVEQ
jgi:hypothetical protein